MADTQLVSCRILECPGELEVCSEHEGQVLQCPECGVLSRVWFELVDDEEHLSIGAWYAASP